jgi:hypothetical protein
VKFVYVQTRSLIGTYGLVSNMYIGQPVQNKGMTAKCI